MSRSGAVRALLALGLLVGPGAVASSAFFTDTATIPARSFATDRLSVALTGGVTGSSPSYTWTGLGLQDLTTTTATRAAKVTVRNDSTRARARISLRGTATNTTGNLASRLQVSVRAGAGAALSGTTCTGGTLVAGPVALASLQADGFAVLAAAQTTDVCVAVTYTGGASAGSSAGVTFTFDIRQVQ